MSGIKEKDYKEQQAYWYGFNQGIIHIADVIRVRLDTELKNKSKSKSVCLNVLDELCGGDMQRKGQILKCPICGREFINDTNRVRVFCTPECSIEDNRIRCRERDRLRRASKPKKSKIKESDGINDVNKKALKQNMSYGQFSAQEWAKENVRIERKW